LPGETVKTITVDVIGDTVDEDDENFSVFLSNPTNANLGAFAGTCTIIDDDASPMPDLTIDDVSVTEGQSVMVQREVETE
jgi:hypothetical protein